MSQTPSSYVQEATRDSFDTCVWAQSEHVPVVVDFWAPWCAPCRQLGPVLEALAREFAGRFVLIKVNTDDLPEKTAEFGVSGIPAVYGVVDGRVVDFFQGALPEPQLRSWLTRLIPSEAEVVVRTAQSMLASDPVGAEQEFRRALALEPQFDVAKVGLAQALARQKKWPPCAELLEALEARGFLEPAAQGVRAALRRHQEAEAAGSVPRCQQAVQADPSQSTSRLQLARALAGAEQFEAALEQALTVVAESRGEIRDAARQVMVDIFCLLPDDSEITQTYRRRLATALY